MYGTLLRNYEAVKDDYALLRRRYDELVASHSVSHAKIEHSQDEILRYKKLYQDMLTERNQFKQQCTQAIRQWDQALRERNDYKDALVKVQRQHDEAVKELNQAMTVRIKASKDLKRLTEERNAAMQEYSLIMSERDSVHKEIEKLQEEVTVTKKKLNTADNKNLGFDEERRKLLLQTEMLKREIEQSLYDRDKAIKESHDLREKLGCGKMSSFDHHLDGIGTKRNSGFGQSRLDPDNRLYRRGRDSVSAETRQRRPSQR
jgi:chromosome segregation ATPase